MTLYQPEVFRGAGIELHILTDYKLGYESMLDLLATKAPEDIRTAIDTTYSLSEHRSRRAQDLVG